MDTLPRLIGNKREKQWTVSMKTARSYRCLDGRQRQGQLQAHRANDSHKMDQFLKMHKQKQ